MAGEANPSAPAAPSVKVFRCPSCGASVTLRAAGQSLTAACASCHSLIDVGDPSYRLICEQQLRAHDNPLIPLGKRGRFADQPYEVIGYMRRSDSTGTYFWGEYLLFNPYRGFRWLHYCNGHWTDLVMIKASVKERSQRRADFDGNTYDLFERDSARVVSVVGEFYWRVKLGDTVKTEDYIDPPRILCKESDAGEIVWSVGEYIEPEAVQAAFGLTSRLPAKRDVAPNQPAPLLAWPAIRWLGTAFAAILVLIQIMVVASGSGKEIARDTFSTSLRTPKVLSSRSFTVDGGNGNLAIDIAINGSFDNTWADFDLTLVDEVTGATREVGKELSYYHGVSSEGAWAEGDRRGRVMVAAVTAGRYHLEIEPQGPAGASALTFGTTVTRGVPVWSNLLIALALISLVPAWTWWRAQRFEMARWSNSNYSPFDNG